MWHIYQSLNRLQNGDYLHSLTTFYRAAVLTNLPVALWYQPENQSHHGVLSLTGKVQSGAVDFHIHKPAFVFAPFVHNQQQPPLRINADIHLAPSGVYRCDGVRQDQPLWNDRQQLRNDSLFFNTYQRLLSDPRLIPQLWFTPAHVERPVLATQPAHERLVQRAVDFMQRSGVRKIVLSRVAETPLAGDFDPAQTFLHLCERYPHAFVSLVAIPNLGTWIGASPELLLKIDGQGINTMALAGTLPKPYDLPLHEVTWGQKEIEEQALVSEYIQEFFRGVGVRRVQTEGPRTVAAGNLVHLQTAFRADLPQFQRLSVANQMLSDLHPTSAVCGMPKARALEFILAHEPHERSFYSGYLGPVHIDGISRLHVNLRCMQLHTDQAYLYVGGGITPQSNPTAEWRETVLKSETLLAVLRPTAISLPTPLPINSLSLLER
jgi:isochorismate synthase